MQLDLSEKEHCHCCEAMQEMERDTPTWVNLEHPKERHLGPPVTSEDCSLNRKQENK
jgi:hypothetical protein